MVNRRQIKALIFRESTTKRKQGSVRNTLWPQNTNEIVFPIVYASETQGIYVWGRASSERL